MGGRRRLFLPPWWLPPALLLLPLLLGSAPALAAEQPAGQSTLTPGKSQDQYGTIVAVRGAQGGRRAA